MLGYLAYNWFLRPSTTLFELQITCVALNDMGIDPINNERRAFEKRNVAQHKRI
jgi:hypothetical protein